jgi:hypothetical protein
VETSRIRKYVAAHGKLEWYVRPGTLVLGHYGAKWDKVLKNEKTIPWGGVSLFRKEIDQWIEDLSQK